MAAAAAVQAAAELLGVRPQVAASLDPRLLSSREATRVIVATALVWLVVEGLVRLLLGGALRRLLYPRGVPSGDARAAAAASKDVTTAAVNVVSVLHVAVQVPIALAVLLDPAVNSDTIYGASPLSVGMCVISSGYFLHDLVVVLARLQAEGLPMLIHACCCLFVYTYAVYSHYLTFYGAGFLLWELSTPLVHARWALAKGGREASTAYVAVGLAMAAVFLACRPVWGTWLSYKFFVDTQVELHHPRPGGFPPSGIWGYRIANVALNALNYYWFSKIAGKAAKLLSKSKSSGSAGSRKQR